MRIPDQFPYFVCASRHLHRLLIIVCGYDELRLFPLPDPPTHLTQIYGTGLRREQAVGGTAPRVEG